MYLSRAPGRPAAARLVAILVVRKYPINSGVIPQSLDQGDALLTRGAMSYTFLAQRRGRRGKVADG